VDLVGSLVGLRDEDELQRLVTKQVSLLLVLV
jgi:hypothetical protein